MTAIAETMVGDAAEKALQLSGLTSRQERLLRVLSTVLHMSHDTLKDTACCPDMHGSIGMLVELGLVVADKRHASYQLTEAGAALVSAATEPAKAVPQRNLVFTGKYDGKDLQDNSTRPGAYTAFRIPSLGACAGVRSAA